MGKIDNDKMWASLISILENTIDIPKMQSIGHYLRIALKDQGLTYRNGKIYTREELNKYALEDPLLGPFDHVDKDFPVNTNLELSPSEETKKSDQELTEFEKAVLNIIPDHITHKDSVEEFARRNANRLLSIARKQIASEINKEKMINGFLNDIVIKSLISPADCYSKGVEDTLKAIEGK